ncbi:sugar transporter [Aspergillus steynii IBT 23096]|uniref:Sugar transporter n=1 Tax=Aspergillus steynii IBT 23096 TaxID=1392250 RepID=A0A2I2FYW5_9EURO|nr:sugar transporter [Aspergillus steynii IBT 23096]PLB45815.1 sugar transporter [Aspergillus steynii IBT 23096]
MFSPKLKIFLIASHVSLSGLCYGLDTGSIGVITQMEQFSQYIGHLTSMQQGIYVSSILLSSSVSSLASGHISDRISRKWGIFIGSILFLIGTIISATAPNFAALIVARLITGMGMGQAISVATVYLVEIATTDIRGVTACLLQLFVVIGIMTGYFIAYGSHDLEGSMAWRVPFIVQAAVAVVLTLGLLLVPFSPRWLVQVSRNEDAKRVLGKLRTPSVVDSELAEIQRSLQSDRHKALATWSEIFSRKYVGRTSLGIFLMSFQQLTGIDVVLYYAPILFRQAGFTSEKASFLSSGVTGIVMLVCTIPAQIWIDRWGRRMPLVIGGLIMSICFIVTGSLYAKFGEITEDAVSLSSKAAQWVVIVLIYIFVANFSWSWAVVGKIYASEIIPTRLRAKVCALELVANWIMNFVVTLTAPLFLRSSPSGPYFLYGFSTIVAVVVCFLMPETKGRSLENIEHLFEKRRDGEEEIQISLSFLRDTIN